MGIYDVISIKFSKLANFQEIIAVHRLSSDFTFLLLNFVYALIAILTDVAILVVEYGFSLLPTTHNDLNDPLPENSFL